MTDIDPVCQATGSAAGVELGRIAAGLNHAPVVYFVPVLNYIKIGTSTNLAARLQSFYLTLEDVLLIVPGGREVEGAYHRRFKDLEVTGDGRRELFEFTGELQAFLTEFQVPAPITTRRRLVPAATRRRLDPAAKGRLLDPPEHLRERPSSLITIRHARENGMLPRRWTTNGAFRTAKSRAKKDGIPVPDVKAMRGSEAMYDATELADFLEKITT